MRTRGAGMHRDLLREAGARHPGNPQAQFAWYLSRAAVPAATGRRRQVSDKTRSDYGDTLKALPALLRALGRPIQNASELRRSHVLALVRHWEHCGHGEGTIQWRVSLLRRFFTLAGRADVLPSGEPWRALLRATGITAGTRGRAQVAIRPKGWRDRGIDPAPILDAMRALHPVVASQQDLSLWFGLRKNEALQLRPAEADQGSHLNIVYGTKGGKPRSIAFSTEPERARQQRAALERAKALAARHPKGILSLPGMNLRQARNHVNYVLRKFGITKKALGVTQHGLRHQFGCDLFTALSGLPAPALATLPAEVYREQAPQLLPARQALSVQMGHERPAITGAYIGSPSGLQRESQRRLQAWLAAAAQLGPALHALGVTRGWIVGKGAWGLPLAAGEALQICLLVAGEAQSLAGLRERLPAVCAAASARMAVPVALSLLLTPDCPPGGAEIAFR